MTLLLSTILLRPYVFLFFAIFLWAAIGFFGWRRALIFTAIAWTAAFIAEFSSTRNGFPFGIYVYIESTREQELWISNIPFFDSFSFTFLAYSSYMMALAMALPRRNDREGQSPRTGLINRLTDHWATRLSPSVLFLSILFFTFVDVVIDPLAVRGDRWFLGKIFYYPDPGVYFGVPVSNFMGWALVGLVTIGGFQLLERKLGPPGAAPGRDVTAHILVGVSLYYLILAFNLILTYRIGERLLGLVGLLIYIPVTSILALRLFSAISVGWRQR